MSSIVTPRYLPDGSVLWEHEAPTIAQRIRDGDPTYGWLGDERLTLVHNAVWVDPDTGKREGRWEVWRDHEDGTRSVVMWRRGRRLPGPALLRALAEHDTRTRDVLSEIDAHNEAVDRDRERVAREQRLDLADKLHWALCKDLGEPMPDGRHLPLSGRR